MKREVIAALALVTLGLMATAPVRAQQATNSPSRRAVRPVDPRLPADEPIVGLEVGAARRAYPRELLRKEEVVNDRVGSEPVVLIHNAKSDTVTVFSRGLDGRTLTFNTGSQGDEVMDVETMSRWNTHGECVDGPLRGTQLKSLTGKPQFWSGWTSSGDTDVYAGRGLPAK